MDRKRLIREYKETPRPMGVYRVHNTVNGRSLIGTSPDVPSILNRIRAELKLGMHPHRQLQADWNELGPDAFSFDVLDTLEPKDEPGWDAAEDLRILEAMWRERLAPDGDPGYGPRPSSGDRR
jgi:hypothetical protein